MNVRHLKGLANRQGHAQWPPGTYEEEHGRQGFAGDASILYRRHPTTDWLRVEGDLRARATDTYAINCADQADARALPERLLFNDDVVISLSRRTAAMPYAFRNADGDEVHLIQRGSGRCVTDYGPLAYGPGDYLVLPKGTNYRLEPAAAENLSYVIETRGEVRFPDRGLLGHQLPVDYALLEVPEPCAAPDGAGEWEVVVKRDGRLTSIFYPFDPMDVVGWQGNLAPYRFNIRDLRPVSVERLDVPPSAYATFQAEGCWICTLTPRPMQTSEDSAPWQPYHRNVDYDEVILLLDGPPSPQLRPGTLRLNPGGVNHGPHPNALAAPRHERFELSLLNIDVRRRLHIASAFEQAEIAAYHMTYSTASQTPHQP